MVVVLQSSKFKCRNLPEKKKLASPIAKLDLYSDSYVYTCAMQISSKIVFDQDSEKRHNDVISYCNNPLTTMPQCNTLI